LIRKLCDKCKKRVVQIDPKVAESAGINLEEWSQYEIYDAVGCEYCNKTGYKGRMAIHEALYFTKEIREMVVKSGNEVDEDAIRRQSKKDGTLTLRDSGLEKVRLGLTSLQEVVAATTED
jgi:type IV pilus assembly protein PilB